MSDIARPADVPAEANAFRTADVIALTVGHTVHDTYPAFMAPLLPALMEQLSFSTTQAGLLTAIMQVPSLLQPVIGHLADRSDVRRLIILPILVTAVAMSLLGVAPGYWALAAIMVVEGVSTACLHAAGPVLAGNLSGPKLGRGMGVWMVGGELGRTLGPILVVSAVGVLGLRGTPWLMIGGILATAVVYLRMHHAAGRPAGQAPAPPWRQILQGKGRFLLPMAGIVVAYSFISIALSTYLPTLLTQQGASLWIAGASLTALEAAGVLGALLGGSLSDRLGRRRVLLASLGGTPLLVFAFLSQRGWVQFALLLALGFVALSITPVMMALVQEGLPESRGLANGLYQATGFAARTGTAVIVGLLGDLFGLSTAFAVSALVLFLALPLLLLMPGRQQHRAA